MNKANNKLTDYLAAIARALERIATALEENNRPKMPPYETNETTWGSQPTQHSTTGGGYPGIWTTPKE